jgi:hypothetical protein
MVREAHFFKISDFGVILRGSLPKQFHARQAGDCGSGCVRTQPLLRCAPKKLREGDPASRFLDKQPPGRAGDCFASLAMTVSSGKKSAGAVELLAMTISAREKSGLALWRYSQ